MIGDIVVLTPDDYKKWLAQSTSGMSLAQNGERLFASLSCNACHNGRPDSRGPSLANVFGSKLTLTNGSAVTADEAYLREAILNPSDHVTQGYSPDHAHLPGTDQRRRRDLAGGIHQESRIRITALNRR